MNMHKTIRPYAALALGIGFVALACSKEPKTAQEMKEKNADQEAKLQESQALITKLRAQIPDQVASSAKCILVVPSYKKGGLIVGGEGGKGFATCQSGGQWSSPAPIDMGGASLGAQIGYESSAIVAIITSDKAVQQLQSGKFEIGASTSAAAGPLSTGSPTSDLGVKGDVLTYAEGKGLFAGVSLDGAKVSADEGATHAMYGTDATLGSVLERRTNNQQTPIVQSFLGTVNKAFEPGMHDDTSSHGSQ
jgi:lipid-binding SYLF domain-containing protein